LCLTAYGGNNTSGPVDVATTVNTNDRYDFESETFMLMDNNAFGVRRLTPVECERLQGFSDGWTDGQSDSARYRQMGNAVAVPVVQWIGERIMESNG